VLLYLKHEEWDKEAGPVIDGFVEFGQEFLAAKDRIHTGKMVDILALGVELGTFSNFDLLVTPPSSSAGPNHMTPKAEGIEERFGIDFEDAIVDLKPHIEMKSIPSASKRREVAREKFECQTRTKDERVLILDDLITSCATAIGVAEAVHERGASQIGVVSIARSVDLYTLKNRNLITEI
jgi:predicted amidophosphoribosyltransferase